MAVVMVLMCLSACEAGRDPVAAIANESHPNVGNEQARWQAVWATAHRDAVALDEQTLRIIVRPSGAGEQLRIKLRNFFGTTPITVSRATVGHRVQGANVEDSTLVSLTFGGHAAVTLAPGEDVLSDPVRFEVLALDDLAISLYVSGAGMASQDPDAYVSSYLSPAGSGDHSAEASADAFTQATPAAVLLEEVSVFGSDVAGTIVATGSSVVDGSGSTPDGYDRWTDWLARRIAQELPAGQRPAIVNAGVGGNTTPDVIARFERDVLDKTGVSHVIIYAGTNDLFVGYPGLGLEVIDNFRTLIERSRAAALKVFIATVTPRVTYGPTSNLERKIVNDWLRRGQNCSGECDGILDFDAAIHSAQNPNQIEPLYDTDTIHPNGTGYGLMAQMINLALFLPVCAQGCSLPLHPVGPGVPGSTP